MRTCRSHAHSPALAITLAVLAVVAPGFVLAAPPDASAAPGVVIGIEQFGGMHEPARRAEILDEQQAAGARVIRFILRHDEVATCNPGAAATDPNHRCYDWGVPDAVVQGAHDRGMRTLLSIYGVPNWQFNGPANYLGTTDAQFDS
jgi:hypothetical protein